MNKLLDLHLLYPNEWVVFDGDRNILDHGTDLRGLLTRHRQSPGKRTFYLAASTPNRLQIEPMTVSGWPEGKQALVTSLSV